MKRYPILEFDPSREALTEPSRIIRPRDVPEHAVIDAPYRETPAKIAARRAEGCLTVEMEAASLIGVAQFRDVVLGQVLYAGDCSGWQRRWYSSRRFGQRILTIR